MTGKPRNIVILTGAGVSAESGIATFRGPDGLWEGHRVEDVATPDAFRRDPDLVLRFYDLRRAALADVHPNPAHEALAELDSAWDGELLLITQNVDDLHDRAGTARMVHMHGELTRAFCRICQERQDAPPEMRSGTVCASCGAENTLRPDIVWFGEMPYHMARIDSALSSADLFVSIGTSGAVYPAAGFVREAAANGARTLELNLEPSEGTMFFDEARHGPAGTLVPAWVKELLG
ncbi:NAD-dependent deacylase [Pacificimonas sp. WHA3]|uniref:NAD-dependent protein deacylase n=1 Tax=Pacificimonas pallii TaxID=2827236 RepID=A0ABS6SC93_9SPHN|nr:NAD-dependent deacylase [Pacificimonas pallii]MBV7256043.1 NAD-dependent deacylase [Pacificimonas pallii]